MLLHPYEPPEPETPPRRALIFDLDGVLVDTLPVMRLAWKVVQDVHGIATPFEDYAAHLGRPFADIMGLLGIAEVEAVHATYSSASVAAAPAASVFDGVQDALRAFAVADWLLAVVTSKPLERAAPLVGRLGCTFAAIHTPSSRGRGSRPPTICCSRWWTSESTRPTRSSSGTSPADREAAQRAGLRFVHAAWGYGGPGTAADEVAQSPAGLLSLLKDGSRPMTATVGSPR